LPKVEGDDEANDSVCVPPPPVDLIGRTSATSIFSSSFSRCMTRTARCLDHSASELKSIYKEGYEETDISKKFEGTAANTASDLTTRIERYGLEIVVFIAETGD